MDAECTPFTSTMRPAAMPVQVVQRSREHHSSQRELRRDRVQRTEFATVRDGRLPEVSAAIRNGRNCRRMAPSALEPFLEKLDLYSGCLVVQFAGVVQEPEMTACNVVPRFLIRHKLIGKFGH
jgi:hypothetical protein